MKRYNKGYFAELAKADKAYAVSEFDECARDFRTEMYGVAQLLATRWSAVQTLAEISVVVTGFGPTGELVFSVAATATLRGLNDAALC